MTPPGLEPRSPGPLTNTLLIRPMAAIPFDEILTIKRVRARVCVRIANEGKFKT